MNSWTCIFLAVLTNLVLEKTNHKHFIVYKSAICPCHLYSPFSVEEVLVFTDLIVTKGQREKFSMFLTKSKCQRSDCRDIKLKGWYWRVMRIMISSTFLHVISLISSPEINVIYVLFDFHKAAVISKKKFSRHHICDGIIKTTKMARCSISFLTNWLSEFVFCVV